MRYPRWNGGPAMGGEFLTREGAERLAGIIRAEWKRAGHDVTCVVVQAMTRATQKEPVFTVVMPTLRNGLPQ